MSLFLKAKIALALLVGYANGLATEQTCYDAWAHDEGKDICAEKIGAPYWGWTNGRYGTSSCEPCGCPACPTLAPSPLVTGTPTKAPTPVPVPLPQQCIGISGSWSGDPHFQTFDGLKYDCQGEGEFHVLKSLTSNFQIQGRFIKFKADKRPTVTKSVVWDTDDSDPIIQVTVSNVPVNGKCLPFVHVDKTIVVNPATSPLLAERVQVLYVKEGSTEGYIFYHHQSGLQATVMGKATTADGCVLSVKFCIPYSWARSKETFVGLLGTPDGNKMNDWMDRSNNPLTVPTSQHDLKFEKAYDFCKNWCVNTEPESLFAYDTSKGESYAYFDHCDLPVDTTTQTCVNDPAAELTNVCGVDDLACLVDGCVGGPVEAQGYLTVTAAMKDANCGKEMFKYDFSEPGAAAEWGTLNTANGNPFLLMHQGFPRIEHIFTVPASADVIEIEFTFLELGQFDSEANGAAAQDFVYLTVGSTQLDLLGFSSWINKGNPEEYFEGVRNGITWNRRAITNAQQNFGVQGIISIGRDQMHKVTAKIPPSYYKDGQLKITFEVDMSGKQDTEAGGIDDIRIIAYGQSCTIAPDPEVPGDLGAIYKEGCGEQVLFEDFQGSNPRQWGTIETQAQNSYIRLDHASNYMLIEQDAFPAGAEALIFEFEIFALGNWEICAASNLCDLNKLQIKLGDTTIGLDLFEKPTPVASGKSNGVEWTRIPSQTKTVVLVDVKIPASFFQTGLGISLTFLVDQTLDIGVGIDGVRMTTYASTCSAVANRRGLREFMDSMDPTSNYEQRHLSVAVETDECQCICPALPNVAPAPGTSSSPRIMTLYYGADDVTCEPEAPSIGNVTMTLNSDGSTVTFTYAIDPNYNLEEVSVYVGDERLPFNELTGSFMPEDDFPFTALAGGSTTIKLNTQLLVCDFYAAVHAKVCGQFPTKKPTGMPTFSPTAKPTQLPTGYPTNSPTLAPSLPPLTTKPTPPPTGYPTSSPKTPAPTPMPTGGSASGDPHVVTWGGDKFDFHGGCDLVLLDNPRFHNGIGMTIHIRTKIVTWWSYIETAVVRIGNETLEVTGGQDHKFLVNGRVGDVTAGDFLFSSLGFKVHLKQATAKQLKVRIDLLNADAIGFEVFKDFVRVNVKMVDMKWKKFEGSVGLMGKYPHGETIGRDNMSVYTDMNAFGQEWQVLESEPKLFSSLEGPQHPSQCLMPTEVSTEDMRRRLGDAMITREDAELVCARVNSGSRDACIFDVLATNDLEMAGSY